MSTSQKKSGFSKLVKWAVILICVLVTVKYLKDSGIIYQVTDKHSGSTDATHQNTTKGGLTQEELTWHATNEMTNEELAELAANTYGWDCKEVVLRGRMTNAGFYSVTCSNSRILRVYPRQYTYPIITNKDGGSQ